MRRNDSDKEQLMRAIQMYCFYLVDLKLYLDTHPDCMEALEFFKEYSELLDEAKQRYAEEYGGITPYVADGDTHFTWTDGPWPWERSANY